MEKVFKITEKLTMLKHYQSENIDDVNSTFIIGTTQTCKSAILMQVNIKKTTCICNIRPIMSVIYDLYT